MVRAFEFFSGKTVNFMKKKRYASLLETASVINILTENGRVRYGTLWYGIEDKFGSPTVVFVKALIKYKMHEKLRKIFSMTRK
jgi:hypothetical protein